MRQGLHFVRTQYFDDLLPEELNKQLRAIQPGVKNGYAAIAGSTGAKVTLEPGILFTGEGDHVELESEYADVPGLDATANAAASDRLDLLFCYYRYVESSPPPQPSYGVKLGTAGSPSLVDFGQNEYQIPVALGLVAAGASVYSAFYPFPRMYRVNHYLVSGEEFVTNGDQTAMRILVIPKTIPALSLEAGIRVEMVEAGTLSDDDEITAWSVPFHLGHDGEAGFNALLAEVVAARGSKASLDARLDVSLNEDGTLNFSGDLGALLAEIVAARGDMTSLDARLDVSLDENGEILNDTVHGHAPYVGAPPVNTHQIIERSIAYNDVALATLRNENILDSTIKARKFDPTVAGDTLTFIGAGDAMVMEVEEDSILPKHCGDRVMWILASISSDSTAFGVSAQAYQREIAKNEVGTDQSPTYRVGAPFGSGAANYFPWEVRQEATGHYQVRPPVFTATGLVTPYFGKDDVVIYVAPITQIRMHRITWSGGATEQYWNLYFYDKNENLADTNFMFTAIMTQED